MDWQLHSDMPILREPEPCAHTDLEWTSTDSAYCRECGRELCAEVDTFLEQLVILRDAYVATG